MAEATVSVILEQMTAITIDKAIEAWSMVQGAEKEVKRLETNFKAHRLELEDAEEKEYVEKRLQTDPSGSASVRNWKIQCRGKDAVPENASVNTFVYEVSNCLKKLKKGILIERLVAFDSQVKDIRAIAFDFFLSFLYWQWDDHPAIMVVGVVDETSEAIFQTLMSLGPSRSQWDFCFYKGCMVEHLDGHTDIVHKQLYSDWLPWAMKRRDLLLRRYWRREDDGIYGTNCSEGTLNICIQSWNRSSGGYVISPVNEGKQSVVKHMLAIDWKFWKSYLRTSAARPITIRMLERVAEHTYPGWEGDGISALYLSQLCRSTSSGGMLEFTVWDSETFC
ncbi:hypothetical protein PVK06_002860 [Gossypium arboreum]|uniref:START domain-containing protein n=1 Tax=Gossypium arboreum TaxID=29729 RepID=A0ABR0R4R2_GOSAR|nr:hypothetical protein PVK06_002860 [Gossypium arboreum]